MQKLKKAALGYIAANLSETEVGSLGDIFHSLDKDNDGFLTLSDLDSAISKGELAKSPFHPASLFAHLTAIFHCR